MADVLVLGGGFGGLAGAAALRDQLEEDDVITLIDARESFFMGFAKLWDLAGTRPLAHGTVPLAGLERRDVRFVRSTVIAIDPAERVVTTTEGEHHADAILVALGSVHAPAHRAMLEGPEAGAHDQATFDLYDAASLPAVRQALDTVSGGAVVISILGGPFQCPPAPFEAALIVDRLLRDRDVRDDVEVVVTTPQPMTVPVAGVDASAYVADHLDEVGVELLADTTVVSIDHGARVVRLAEGDPLPYRLLLGVPAVAPPPVLADSPLLGGSGWIEPDRHTLATAFDGVYAVGDCTHIPTAIGALPKAGVFAAGEAEVAARNIAADLHGGERAHYDGHGYCFLELPDEQVAFVEGDFYAEPRPDVTLTEADHDQFLRKQTFERDRLAAWLG